jgi:hypothetical protein
MARVLNESAMATMAAMAAMASNLLDKLWVILSGYDGVAVSENPLQCLLQAPEQPPQW